MRTPARPLRVVLPAMVAGVALALSGLVISGASSHREAPLIAEDPVADNTDTYAFVSPDKPDTVTLVAQLDPARGACRRPELPTRSVTTSSTTSTSTTTATPCRTSSTSSGSRPRIGTGTRSCTTPVRSSRSTTHELNVKQTYTVTDVEDGKSRRAARRTCPVAPANIGPRSTPNYDALAADGGRSRSGRRSRCSPVRVTTRSSSTWAPSSTSRPAAAEQGARDPAAGRARRRRSAGLQRALDRPPGADVATSSPAATR